jgi:hypothetical protein
MTIGMSLRSSIKGSYDSINLFNPANIVLCLSETMAFTSNAISRGPFSIQWFEVKAIVRFVDTD